MSDVGVYLGWAGRWTRAAHTGWERRVSAAARVPGVGWLVDARPCGGPRAPPPGRGPPRPSGSDSRTIAVARTLDGVGRELSRVRVEGPSPYDLTAELLAWGAAMLLTGRRQRPGALGPADAFGLDALVAGCADMGLRRVE